MDAQFWDDLYGSRDQLFSGNPNGVLVTEAGDLNPGQALDVGCGEGGDALWLARRGWRVTAVDISRTAVERAAIAGRDVDGRVAWMRADLTRMPVPIHSFDLVTVQYFPLRREADHRALRRLLSAVAPGGTLLFVGHDPADLDAPQGGGDRPDPRDFYQPAEVARILAEDRESWTVLVDETRPRTVAAPAGTHHTHDTVLRARRSSVSESAS